MKLQTRFITTTEAKVLIDILDKKSTGKIFQTVRNFFTTERYIEVNGIDNIYISELANRISVSDKTVRNSITFLVKKKFLERKGVGHYFVPEGKVITQGTTIKLKDSIIIGHE